jgi:hypothetical protein
MLEGVPAGGRLLQVGGRVRTFCGWEEKVGRNDLKWGQRAAGKNALVNKTYFQQGCQIFPGTTGKN